MGRSNLPQFQQSSRIQILDPLNQKFLDPPLNCHLELHIFFQALFFFGGGGGGVNREGRLKREGEAYFI